MAEHPAAATAADPLEPGVRVFVDGISREFERRAGGRELSLAERRGVAEVVRAPWRSGGPAMATVRGLLVPGEPPVRIRVLTPPSAPGPNGALVYLHGGGWTLFSLDTHDRLMREYAARSGLTVIGVDYSLSPEAKFPVALTEIGRVLDWLVREGACIGVDASRIVIGGDSAGANLALAAALALRNRGSAPSLRGLLLNYGCFQTEVSPDASERFGGARFMLTTAEMADFWRNYLRTPDDRRNPLACPMQANLAGLPPSFVAIAECDILAEQSVALSQRLAAAQVEVVSRTYAGASHSFLEAVSVSDLSGRALDDASAWLREVCA